MRICDKCIHDKVCLLSKSRANCELFDEKRPHGEWIKSPVGSYCSNCKSTVPFNPLGKEYFSPFCMECGADMRKEGEAE